MQPIYKMADEAVLDDFDLEYFGKVDQVIPVFKYRAKQTGIRVVIAQVEGPLVNGFFCLATEAHDDDGLPHTLEHLIFMGSEDYPYKGVLDLLANRCFASGTNAWTDTDHTCYTMTTAGSAGFLNLMPIFLDHILYPTLSEFSYVTEVHHINGEGDDAGVVYCEMQARENSGESRTHLEMLRSMYPGQCGYQSETGGILANLRTSTSHVKVKNYFQQYYRPENFYLIVTGMVEPNDILRKVQAFEKKIISKGERAPYERPWQSKVLPLPASVEKTVQYGCDDDAQGMVTIGWRGPLAEEQYLLAAVMLLFEYLTDTAVSPLQRDFVELEEPFCSEVRYSVIENSESCVYLHFDNVPVEHLADIKQRLFDLLSSLGAEQEKIDMTRLHNVIHRQLLSAMSSLEDSPHDTVAFHIIGEFLYGNTEQDMDLRLNNIETFRQLDKEPLEFWINVLNNYFVNQKYVAIIGEPSNELMQELGQAEIQRIMKQKEELKEEGLRVKQDILEAAIRDNERAPSSEVLTSVQVPDVSSIHFHTLTPYSNHDNTSQLFHPNFSLADIKVTFQLDDIKTNFVTMTVLMETSDLPLHLRCYLPLFLEVLLESPVIRDGVLVSHDDVIKQLTADTVYNATSLGVEGSRFTCGQFSTVALLSIKVEMDKYETGVRWLRDLLYHVQFVPERIKIIASKMSSDVAKMKRSGNKVVSLLMSELNYKSGSNKQITSMLRQHKFLTQLIQQLDKDPAAAQQLTVTMKSLRDLVTRPARLRVHVAAHVDRLRTVSDNKDLALVWTSDFIPSEISSDGERPVVKRDLDDIEPLTSSPYTSLIAGVGSVESSYLILSTSCLSDYEHPDVPAILIYIQYMTKLEGPMWKQIRGLGLSYQYLLYMKLETGLLYFSLRKSSQLVEAYKQAKKIIDDYLSGVSVFDEVELESSKSSLIFEIIEEEKTPAEASVQSLLSYFRGTTHGYNRRIMKEIPSVTLEDLRTIGQKYFSSLFDLNQSKIAICCHPTKVEEIFAGFKAEFGKGLKTIESLDASFLTDMAPTSTHGRVISY